MADLDPFASANAKRIARAEREAREAGAAATKRQAQKNIKANQAKREAMAKPEPRYRPRCPIFDL